MKKIKKSKKKKQQLQDFPIVRYSPDHEFGLSEEQINERKEHKLVNDTKIKTSNSYLSIICKNVFTIFNIIWIIIAIALMCVNSWGNLLFMFVVIANTAISIFQEIKAKNTVEKLSMVTAPRVKVVRTGLQLEIKCEELLLDDIVILENGNQIPADCIIEKGEVEVNESLLTGESNCIKKQTGDTLLAGSFLVSGMCYARVDKIGKENYIQTVAERTKDFKPQTSNLFKDLNNLIKVILLVLIPSGVLTFFNLYYPDMDIVSSITKTSGAITGMIPAGMYLLITVGLSVGVIKLARKKTLVKNLYSIEMLARANVLCLDKTGTITDGTMKVVNVLPTNSTKIVDVILFDETKQDALKKSIKSMLAENKTFDTAYPALIALLEKEQKLKASKEIDLTLEKIFKSNDKYCLCDLKNSLKHLSEAQQLMVEDYRKQGNYVAALVEKSSNTAENLSDSKIVAFAIISNEILPIMKTVLAAQKTMNATSVALVEQFGKEINPEVKNVVEFSSQRKYSATTLKNGKTYYIGAAGFIKCNITAQQKKQMNQAMEQGYRVVVLVEDENAYSEKMVGKRGKLLAIFVLEDHIRKDAVETIAWFKKNNVDIKIISGDDAVTVSKIARRVGVENSDKFISLEGMSLQDVAQIANNFTVFGRVTPEQKHVIIKSLKTQGNVVAMTGDGVNDTLALKEANCSIAMADGSEVARNISHLVLLQSNFSALPSIVKEGRKIVNNVQNSSVLYLMKTLFTMILCLTTLILGQGYPFEPKQLLLLEMFVIGLPSFILTFQPNNNIIKGNFIPQVLKKSIPCAIIMFINVLVVLVLNQSSSTLTGSEFTSLCTMILTFVGFINLVLVCWPLNWLRGGCVALSATLIIAAIAGFGKFFAISDFTFPVMTTLITLLLCTIIMVVGIYYLIEWLDNRNKKIKENSKSGKDSKILNTLQTTLKVLNPVSIERPELVEDSTKETAKSKESKNEVIDVKPVEVKQTDKKTVTEKKQPEKKPTAKPKTSTEKTKKSTNK